MIVESAPVIPGNEYGRAVPVLALHDRVYGLCHEILTRFKLHGWVIACGKWRRHPGHCGQIVALYVLNKLIRVLDIVWRIIQRTYELWSVKNRDIRIVTPAQGR